MENDSKLAYILDQRKGYPDLRQAWSLFGVFLLATLLASGLQSGIMSLLKFIGISISSSWFLVINYVFSFSITILYARTSALREGINLKLNLGKVPLFVFVLLLFITPALSTILELFVSLIPMPDYVEELFAETFKFNSFTFVAAVIAAPLFEEILCRGIIFKGLLQHYSPSRAMFHSALIFAVLHLNPWQAIPAFILGMLMAWSYFKTNSILVPIFIHLVNNGLSFTMLAFDDQAVSGREFWGNDYRLVLIISLVTLIAAGYLLVDTFQKMEDKFTR